MEYYLRDLAYAQLNDVHTPAEFFTNYFNYIYTHHVMFKTFTNSFVWPQFTQRIQENAEKEYHRFLTSQSADTTRVRILTNYVVSAHTGVVIKWLHEDPLTPPAIMASTMTSLTTGAMQKMGFNFAKMFPLPSNRA